MQHEAGPQHAAVTEHQREQPDNPLRAWLIGEHRAEMREVDLRLTSGRRLEAHLEGSRLGRPDLAQEVGENAVAAGVAEFAQLTMQATPGQLRNCRKPLAQIAHKRRDLARPWRPRAIQRRLQTSLDVFVHRLPIEPHLAGNRRYAQALPMQFKDHHHLPKPDQRRASRMESRHHQTSADRPPQAPLNSPGENSIGTSGEYSAGTHRCGRKSR